MSIADTTHRAVLPVPGGRAVGCLDGRISSSETEAGVILVGVECLCKPWNLIR